MTVDRRTITAYGAKVGTITDPAGDDNGPGSYTYPTDGAFNAGSLDLTGLEVYEDGDTVRFVASTAGAINNPWGGNGMSTQRLNIYLSDGESTATTPLLPGTNTSAEGPWTYAIVADGRYDSSRFGSGVYGDDLQRVGDITLDVDPAGKIIASVPASTLSGLDLSTAGYQVSMFSDAEDGEGIGNIRPVYSAGAGPTGSAAERETGPTPTRPGTPTPATPTRWTSSPATNRRAPSWTGRTDRSSPRTCSSRADRPSVEDPACICCETGYILVSHGLRRIFNRRSRWQSRFMSHPPRCTRSSLGAC